jgi:hypothetical protein
VRDTNPAIPPQQAPAEKKTFKRRRCENCNKLYMPSRADQKFCRNLPDPDKCRKEFYRYGSSYGPLKTGLHKAIDKKYRELERETNATIRAHRVRIDGLVDENRTMRALLQKALDRFEGHTHSVQEYTDYGTTYMEAGPPQIVAVERNQSDVRPR